MFPDFERGDLWRRLGRGRLPADRGHTGVGGMGPPFAVLFPGFGRDDLRRRRRRLPADPDGAGVGGIGLALVVVFLVVLFPGLERGDLWFRHRQWDLACRKKIELARKQHHEVAGMVNAIAMRSASSPAPQ